MTPSYTIWYDEHSWSPLSSQALGACMAKELKNTLGFAMPSFSTITYESNHTLLLVEQKELTNSINRLVDRIMLEPKWADTFNPKSLSTSQTLLDSTRKNALSIKDASNDELVAFFDQFLTQVTKQFNFGVISVLAESNEGQLSQRYYAFIKNRIGEGNYAALSDLLAASGQSAPAQERAELLNLALAQNVNGLQNHAKKWRWLYYGFIGPATSDAYFQDAFTSLMTKKESELLAERDHLLFFEKNVERKRNHTMDHFGLDENQRLLTQTIAHFASTKYQRKENLTHAHYEFHAILAETARRLHVSISQLRLMMLPEIEQALKGKPLPDLATRAKKVAYQYPNGKSVVLNDSATTQLESLIQTETISTIKELRGMCANPGTAKGRVCIINTPDEMTKMKSGDILVSDATYPELIPSIRKASAIVTNRGGVTCHAAIVSRELGIPCLIATKHATNWLKDGDSVDVDATKGKVTKV